ncbi:unnamed protein product [Taenia asiatica]|uniref:Secreted protein n=1 Tax=Taenia asiatica TaxID=60517 RepID=A0A0R3W2W4_TAEAS|nr:unnamed protein product [Taenia asiatica]
MGPLAFFLLLYGRQRTQRTFTTAGDIESEVVALFCLMPLLLIFVESDTDLCTQVWNISALYAFKRFWLTDVREEVVTTVWIVRIADTKCRIK